MLLKDTRKEIGFECRLDDPGSSFVSWFQLVTLWDSDKQSGFHSIDDSIVNNVIILDLDVIVTIAFVKSSTSFYLISLLIIIIPFSFVNTCDNMS